MLTIYRYEGKGHLGPYSLPELFNHFQDDSCLADHPRGEQETWIKLGPMCDHDNARYGFVDMTQLTAWFGADDQEYLALHGCSIVTYSVHEDYVDIGRYQARFDLAGIIS